MFELTSLNLSQYNRYLTVEVVVEEVFLALRRLGFFNDVVELSRLLGLKPEDAYDYFKATGKIDVQPSVMCFGHRFLAYAKLVKSGPADTAPSDAATHFVLVTFLELYLDVRGIQAYHQGWCRGRSLFPDHQVEAATEQLWQNYLSGLAEHQAYPRHREGSPRECVDFKDQLLQNLRCYSLDEFRFY